MTGAPSTGVTAFSGIMPDSPGRIQMRLQSKATALPVSKVTGRSELWFEVPIMRRAICGTANPINETGPQKAVVTAVRMPVEIRSRFRVLLIFTPKFSAYLLPKRSALSGFIKRIDRMSPAIVKDAKYGICSRDTPLKLPIPQIMYECTPSAVAKKLSNEMADEVM